MGFGGGNMDCHGMAGRILPAQVPKPTRREPLEAAPVMTTESPSCRERRTRPVSPRTTSLVPPYVSSSMHARLSSVGPLTVPEAMRSPGRRLQPVEVWWASICAMVQYTFLKLLRVTTAPVGWPLGTMRTSSAMSYVTRFFSLRYSSTGGSCGGAGHRNGSRASRVMIQGDMEVAKFLALNGPSGTYSHRCTSRALQSFMITMPKMCSWALLTSTGRPCSLPGPTKNAISSSKSRFFVGPYVGLSVPT
mmetsp:Transcript_13634/g.23349  ORF Transcript_13634/g.23349 Transcript_13634/m.23349 type:complete len:248 (+) Transcript_13634:849-1592(+)